MSWARYIGKDREIVVKRSVIDYGWAALYQTKKLSEYALTYDYDRYYHIIYDTEIDDTVVSTFLSDKKCNFFPKKLFFFQTNYFLYQVFSNCEW